MEKIDRLGWAAGLSFVAYGRRIGIRVNDPEVLGQLPDRLPPGWKRVGSPIVEHLYSLLVGGNGGRANVRRFNLLYAGSARLARTMDLEEVFESLESDLHLTVAEAARGRLFVHAGVVGWRGKAIILPGRTLSGKTTLVAALVRAGATYYSDEYAVFDARGRVHPYPKALSIRDGNGARPRKSPAAALGGLPGVMPLPVGLVAVTGYRPGVRWRPRRLPPGQAILELLANTVAARRRPKAALATLLRVVSRAPVLKAVRGEAEEVLDAMLEQIPGGEAAPRDGGRSLLGGAMAHTTDGRMAP
jgi:hypothetical protein